MSKTSKKRKNYKLQNKKSAPTGYISVNHCDNLSKLRGLDVEELLIDIDAYLLTLRNNLGITQDVTFGIEIEFEQAVRDEVKEKLSNTINASSNNNWVLKHDSTVTTHRFGQTCGGEINTPILRDVTRNWTDLNKVCKILTDLKATAENLAGGHIHFGTQILGNNPTYWVNMVKLWSIYEKIIYRFAFGDKLGARENMDSYASPISYDLYKLLPKITRKNHRLSNLINLLPSARYQAINFQNVKSSDFATGNTIELRCPNSTLSPIVWQNNVNLFAKFFLYCKSGNFDADFIESKLRQYHKSDNIYDLYQEIYLQEALELSDLIFKNNLDKVYFLKQYLKSFTYEHKKGDNVKQIKL